MLTKGDDYPLHQSPEPMAFAGGDRNFYDRYFFNGYSADGSLFFAAALGVYPQLDIMDAAFCVCIDGVQHNLRASKHMGSERLNLSVGPITLEIVEPLAQLRLSIAPNDASPIRADIVFTARHSPIEEPRFTRRQGPRLLMDYTRLTQNGGWSGEIVVGDQAVAVNGALGTRDRSWGIRPVGASDPQPPVGGALPQFWWLWMPLNFAEHASFFHSNDDGMGQPWNRRGVIAPLTGEQQHFDAESFAIRYRPGGRRVAEVRLPLQGGELIITPRMQQFYMSGLGYLHPKWGHGMDHGPLDIGYDQIVTDPEPTLDMTMIHIQAMADAVLRLGDREHHGHGVVEQLFIGPHASSGLSGLMDPAP